MSMNYILLALLITPADGPTPEPDQSRLCNIGPRGSVQLAYKPYGNPVFGSDGLMCATVKPDREDAQPAAGRQKARADASKRKRGS